LFKLGSIDVLEDVHHLVEIECWGINEYVHCVVHLARISKNLVMLPIQPLVFLFQEFQAQLCEVEVGALLKIVD
jgi:hypothetical protein